jgi:hypothetical protein
VQILGPAVMDALSTWMNAVAGGKTQKPKDPVCSFSCVKKTVGMVYCEASPDEKTNIAAFVNK